MFGDRLRDVADRVAAALATLQVMSLPQEVRDAYEAAADYLERLATHRSSEIKAEWPSLYERLNAAGRLLGSSECE